MKQLNLSYNELGGDNIDTNLDVCVLNIINGCDLSNNLYRCPLDTCTNQCQLDLDCITYCQLPVKLSSLQSMIYTNTSTTITSTVNMSDPCISTTPVTYSWSIDTVSPLPVQTHIDNVNSILQSENTDTLSLSEYLLLPNHNYTFSLNVTGIRTTGQSISTISTYTIEVLSSDLVATISDGDRMVSIADIVLDASNSYDPDQPLVSGQTTTNELNFTWYIRESSESSVNDKLVNLTSSHMIGPTGAENAKIIIDSNTNNLVNIFVF